MGPVKYIVTDVIHILPVQHNIFLFCVEIVFSSYFGVDFVCLLWFPSGLGRFYLDLNNK